MNPSVEVVVAKYKEDTSWLRHISRKVTIYDKSDNPVERSQHLENIGRESNTYLYHIVQRYESLSDITIFLQGRAYDHCDLVGNSEYKLIQYINNLVNIDTPFQALCQPLRNPLSFSSDFRKWYDRAKSKRVFKNTVSEDKSISYGAQYIVRKDAILSKSIDFWTTLYEMSKTTVYGDDREDKIDPWTFELMWTCIFDPSQIEAPLKLVKSVMINDSIGFADFLRGSITLKLLSNPMSYTLELDYSKHTIGEYLNNRNYTNIEYEISDINVFVVEQEKELHDFLKRKIGPRFVLTNVNYFPYKITPFVFHKSHLEEDMRMFLQTSIEPRESILSGVSEYMNELNLSNKEFATVHVRLGDCALIEGISHKSLFDTYLNKILPHVNEKKVLLVSDDIQFKAYASEKTNWKILNRHIGHTAKQYKDKLAVLNSLIEFFVMSHARSIVHLTTYSTGPSGFSRWCSEIFDIPYLQVI